MLVTMTDKDIYRLGIIQRVHDHTLLQREAARLLELTVLLRRYGEHGAASVVSARRGRPGNNRIPEDLRCAALQLIRQHYADFGPTLATEKLLERHGISVSVETVRNWMISDGLWRPHSRRQVHIYQPRHRRDCLGELIQLDGSHHAWFDERAPKCCLLVYIDDATGRLMHLRFCDSESAFDYMTITSGTGRIRAEYYSRTLHELNVQTICAETSAAKGHELNIICQALIMDKLPLSGLFC